MQKTVGIFFMIFSFMLTGCATSRHAKPDPADEARAQIAKGSYGLMGLADFSNKDFWIPGVAGHKRDHNRYDVTWHGISGPDDPYVRLAEPYMIEFNRIMLESRKGMTLDVYGRSEKSRDYHSPRKNVRDP